MSTSDERGRIAKDRELSQTKKIHMIRMLKARDHSNKNIAYIMRTDENDIRHILEANPIPEIEEEKTIWYPGFYEGRTDGEWIKMAMYMSFDDLVGLVQMRAYEDGEWSIKNGHVGDNEDKMRRWMAFVSKPRNIQQCVEHIHKEERDHEVTVDWVCRELAEASMMVVK